MAEFEQIDFHRSAVAEFVSPNHCFAEPSLKYFLKDIWTVGFNIFSQIHLTSKDNTWLCYCLSEQLLRAGVERRKPSVIENKAILCACSKHTCAANIFTLVDHTDQNYPWKWNSSIFVWDIAWAILFLLFFF